MERNHSAPVSLPRLFLLQDLHEGSAPGTWRDPSPFHSRKGTGSWLIMVMDVEGSGVTSSLQSTPKEVKPILQAAFPVRVSPWGQERRKSLPDFHLSESPCHCWRQQAGLLTHKAGHSSCSSSHIVGSKGRVGSSNTWACPGGLQHPSSPGRRGQQPQQFPSALSQDASSMNFSLSRKYGFKGFLCSVG